jgi:hypothetical protein
MSTIEIVNPIQDSNAWKMEKALDIKSRVEKLLFGTGSLAITNKSKRQIKKLFNEQVNLTDKMFQGMHADGRIIGSFADDEAEINLLYQVLKKTPSISFTKAENTIKKWMSEVKNSTNEYSQSESQLYPTKNKELIIRAYSKYMQEVKNKKVQVKTRGIDLVTKCFSYWESEIIDSVLEEQINKTCDELKTLVSSSFDEKFTFDDFSNSLILILDISGSMDGVPLNTGLFYMLMMVKIFGIKTLYYFESKLEIRKISSKYTSNLDLIKQIYSDSKGSTNLASVFQHLNSIMTSNKNVIIITDGDCDPGCYTSDRHGYSANPFHEVTRIDKKKSTYPHVTDNNYVVVNVKQEKMNFPYLDVDPNVCYLTGNNPKTLNGFIKALCESTKSNTAITPDLVLKYTLSMEELDFGITVPTFSSVMSDERIGVLFETFKKNLPPKKINSTDLGSGVEVEAGVEGEGEDTYFDNGVISWDA